MISMNSPGYIIMDIHDATHNKYGDVLRVKANPIQDNGFSTYFTPYENEDTELFFVSLTQRFIDSLVATAHARKPWKPQSSDYFEETVNIGGKRCHSFVHVELLEDEYDDDENYHVTFHVDDVRFGKGDEIDLGFSSEKWDFGLNGLKTPHGNLVFDGFYIVNNDDFVGAQLSARGLFKFTDYKDYHEGYNIPVKTVAFVRHPHNVWLWIYMLDSSGDQIACFCGHEEGDEFEDFMNYLQENY